MARMPPTSYDVTKPRFTVTPKHVDLSEYDPWRAFETLSRIEAEFWARFDYLVTESRYDPVLRIFVNHQTL